MKLVSVIIPAYNPQDYLLSCLGSVFGQTHAQVEVILVNDGSKSEFDSFFADVGRRYPQLKILEVKPNRGVAHARNHGAGHATGDYLTFIDQDDVWETNKLELQSRYLDQHADYDYVTSRQRYFLSEGVDVPPGWLRASQLGVSLPGFLPGTLMVRASAFKQLGGFDERLKAGTDDVDWFFRANAAGLKTFELPEQLLLKRIHSKNLSGQALAHNKELLSVVRMNLQRKKASGQNNE
jgi:GT2 family glycosyltransferase